MVGPRSDSEQGALFVRLKVFFVLLVGMSAGLMGLGGGGTLVESGALTLFGLLIGSVLVWIVFPNSPANRERRSN